MPDFKFEVDQLEREIDAFVMSIPELAEDEALRADMIEGSLDVESVMSRIISHYLESVEMLDGIKPRQDALAERKARYEKRLDTLKALAQRILSMSGQKSITTPEATVSVSKGRESVIIDDVMQLPQGTYTTERKADKAAIKAQIAAGEDVPGAHMETGPDGLTVRTK